MVELSSRQGHDGYRQLAQFFIIDGGVGAQRAAKLRVKVVFFKGELSGRTAGNSRALHEQLDRLVAQQPDADVRQVEMVFLQHCQLFHAGFLQHLLQHARRLTATDEDTMVLGDGGIEPQAIADHIGLGHLTQSLCGTDIHVATDNHGCQTIGCLFHDSFIERQLQVEQCLREALATLPTEHGDGRQYLAADSIRRQSAALSAGMQNDAPLTVQPCLGLLQQPGGAPTRP